MPIPESNVNIARALEEIAELLELRGANPFRVRAYHDAARTIGSRLEPIAPVVADDEEDRLLALPGIGADLAGKIHELARTGHTPLLDELRQETPPGLRALLGVPGLGPRRVRAIHDALGIGSLAELEHAAASGALRGVRGVGAKTEERILAALRHRPALAGARVPRDQAERLVAPLVAHLRGARGLRRLEIAGSFRRRRPDVGDIDLLAAVDRDNDVVARFTGFPGATPGVAGPTRAALTLPEGLQVDLRVIPERSWGAALVYFTGSKAFNVRLRGLAARQGLKLNEYGLWRGRRRVAGATEAEIFTALGLPWTAPDDREA